MAFEYFVDGRVVSLPVNPGRIAVRFKEPLDQAARRTVIDPKPQVGSFDDRIEVPDEKFTIVETTPSSRPGTFPLAAAADALNSDPAVERVAPIFDLGQTQAMATDRILIGFKPETKERAAEIIKDYGGEIVQASEDEYVVRLHPAAEPFDVIANLTKRGEVDYAEPDFVTLGRHTPLPPSPEPPHADGDDEDASAVLSAPDESDGPLGATSVQPASNTDPLRPLQYAVTITRADQAWDRVAADAAITIAILDEGVDVTHPDLQGAIRGSFDAIDGDSDQQPNPWDGHGTACAGLAAAIPNNNLGIRGTGGGCSLLAVRIARSPSSDRGRWQTTNSKIRDAIDWSWQNGADILSNSWGGGAPSTAIIKAFERARTRGRNGMGCVILVAAGNDSGSVSFPGKLPNVLTVAASNEFDEPKTRISQDGENWWGSNFGLEVDIAAPGVHNYTTDISGTDGYNAGGAVDADYVDNFNGTSSSTPIVAGVAALVLSANPNLREAQVRRILKESADKVGQVIYFNNRSDLMGYGRVNALRAVELAIVAV